VMGVDNQTALPHAAAMSTISMRSGGRLRHCLRLRRRACEKVLGSDQGPRPGASASSSSPGAHTPCCDPPISEPTRREPEAPPDRSRGHLPDAPRQPACCRSASSSTFFTNTAGRAHAHLGASNWTLARIQRRTTGREESQDRLRRRQQQLQPRAHGGCAMERMPLGLDARGARWLKETQMPLLPWSSQARGFYRHAPRRRIRRRTRNWSAAGTATTTFSASPGRGTGQKNAGPPHPDRPGLRPCQPFPTFPLIGRAHWKKRAPACQRWISS